MKKFVYLKYISTPREANIAKESHNLRAFLLEQSCNFKPEK